MGYKSDVKYPLISDPSKMSYCTVDPSTGRLCRIHFHENGVDMFKSIIHDPSFDFEDETTPITFENSEDVDIIGTSLRGYITATRNDIAAVFGEPTFDGSRYEDKVTTEWYLEFSDGTVASIYDWKRYEDGQPAGDEVIQWNIGGKTNRAVDLVEEFMGISY